MRSWTRIGRSRLALCTVLSLFVVFLIPGCGKKKKTPEQEALERVDALFLPGSPAVIPPELSPEFKSMKIGRLYLAGATLAGNGKVTPLPPPADNVSMPFYFTIIGESNASKVLSGVDGASLGQSWASSLAKPLEDAKAWGNLAGIHLHIIPELSQFEVLAAALKAVSKAAGLPVSVTVRAGAPATAFKVLEGSVDEVLILSFGRRPETGDELVHEMTEADAKAIPVPFRVLVSPGGYGFAGASANPAGGRRLSDGEIDQLSEDKNLDFDFGQVLSTEPGTIYNFKPKAGVPPYRTILAPDGGFASFRILVLADLVRFVGATSRWGDSKLMGRVFIVDGLPRDGHLIDFETLNSLLSGRPIDPVLEIAPTRIGGRDTAFQLSVTNKSVAPTGLSRLSNYIRLRVEGGVFSASFQGDFDRFETLDANNSPAPFGRATIVKLYENFFAPMESNEAGPIRVAGTNPKVFISYQLTQTDGRMAEAKEIELSALSSTGSGPGAKAGR